MEKRTAISLLGGSVRSAATKLNLSTQAVAKWEEEGPMSRPVSDKVLAHHLREACKRDPSVRKLLKLPLDALQLPPEPVAKEAFSNGETTTV